jgi:ABC-2 type transport system ATP-binding protein
VFIIEIKDLYKKYKEIIAVNKINLSIEKGEIFGFLGPNGAGKTTTLMMLTTLIKPTSGTATVNGYDIIKNPLKVRQSIGMVFQDPSSDPVLTAYENLKLHAFLYNVPLKEIDIKIDYVLELVDLIKRKNDIVKTYSGGMRRRMEIARGLIHTPEILFLDEPTLGLDPQTRGHIWEYIKKLAEEKKMTVILTTHYMEEAEKLCKRVAIIDHGKIVALDTPDNLKRALGGDIVILKGKNINIKDEKLKFIKNILKTDNYIQITIENCEKNLSGLLKKIDGIESIEVHPVNLNDVFLSLTGKEIRD